MSEFKKQIREIPDFPRKGILFRDITTLLREAKAFDGAVRALAELARPFSPEIVACVESRGFLFGATLAQALSAGVVPIRKPGKLPAEVYREQYSLEYGKDALEVHKDAFHPGERVLIVDDLLATGGTAAAAGRLVTRGGATVVGYAFLVELLGLRGRDLLGGAPVVSLVSYEGA